MSVVTCTWPVISPGTVGAAFARTATVLAPAPATLIGPAALASAKPSPVTLTLEITKAAPPVPSAENVCSLVVPTHTAPRSTSPSGEIDIVAALARAETGTPRVWPSNETESMPLMSASLRAM